MSQHWYKRLLWWLCEKAKHPAAGEGWIYEGFFHRNCNVCGRIVSKPLKVKQ